MKPSVLPESIRALAEKPLILTFMQDFARDLLQSKVSAAASL